MSKNKCCIYHDDMDFKGEYYKCGSAGMGAVSICCHFCPDLKWYKENQPTRPIDFYSDWIKETSKNEAIDEGNLK